MNLEIRTNSRHIQLVYFIEGHDDWLGQKLEGDESYRIKGIFSVSNQQLEKRDQDGYDDDIAYFFNVGKKVDDYYKLNKNVLNLKNDFFIHVGLDVNISYFIANKSISILGKIDSLINEPFYLGGEYPESLPIDVFEHLLEKFPNSYEVNLYRDARVGAIIGDYFETTLDSVSKYKRYQKRKSEFVGNLSLYNNLKYLDTYKYETVLLKLEEMLNSAETYKEPMWQDEILSIILLLFPKYIRVIRELKFKDVYSGKNRFLDFGLIDFTGHLDIIEIKQPFDDKIITMGNSYRDNYIPKRELSGTVMQIEKYIYFLNKIGKRGEKRLTKRYKEAIPVDMSIYIKNPKGIIIMGRDHILSKERLHDLEIIKRKYRNVADIITYDDLLRRLRAILANLNDDGDLQKT